MAEAHVFCGPEFTLYVPREAVATVFASASSPSAATVRDEVLLQLQADIYSVCTTALRYRLHATYSSGNNNSSSGRVVNMAAPPPPPARVCLVAVKSPDALSSEEHAALQHTRRVLQRQPLTTTTTVSSVRTGATREQTHDGTTASSNSHAAAEDDAVYTVLLITDARVAGEVYMLALRNMTIALAHGCRLHCYIRATARAAPVVLRDVLAKREQLRAHHNLDADLWSALEDKCTATFVRDVLAAVGVDSRGEDNDRGRGGGEGGDRDARSGRLLTAAEQHAARVRALLHYCETTVQYAAVLDANEEASPFLCAMGLFFAFRLGLDDVLRHCMPHPRRVVRAVGLFVARYLVAPEEMAAYVAPCLHDAVVIACSHDMTVTHALRELCLALLRDSEVGEAWLPAYHPYWREHVIEPCLARLQAQHDEAQRRQREAATAATAATTTDDTTTITASAATAAAGRYAQHGQAQQAHMDTPVGNTKRPRARGVAASLGFRRLADVAAYAAAHERSLVPQHMSTLLARQRVRTTTAGAGDVDDIHARNPMAGDDADGGRGGDDDGDDSGEDSDGFLIHVDVADGAAGDVGQATAALHTHDVHLLTTATSTAAAVPPSTAARAYNGNNKKSNSSSSSSIVDAHAMVVAKGNKLLLSLLGRTRPFSSKDEHYLVY